LFRSRRSAFTPAPRSSLRMDMRSERCALSTRSLAICVRSRSKLWKSLPGMLFRS